MKITQVMAVLFTALVVAVVAGAGLVMWTVERTEFHSDRTSLAHRSYHTHLRLSSHSNQLFKQYADTLLLGDQAAMNDRLTKLIAADIADIRQTIEDEIALVGEEEEEELELLDDVEAQIAYVIQRFDSLLVEETPRDPLERWQDFSRLLDLEIDTKFDQMMTVALEEELEEVEETHEQQEIEFTRLRLMAIVLAGFAGLMALLLSLYYIMQIAHPMRLLLAGVDRLRKGQLSTPINAPGRNEIARISGVLDSMAADMAAHSQTLEDYNAQLEIAVANRTHELERLLQEAKANEASRVRLLGDVSHELKTPLTIIRGESELALRSKTTSTEEYREALTRTRDAAVHTSALIDDLLFVARQEDGKALLQREPTEMVQFLKDVSSLSPVLAPLQTDHSTLCAKIDRLRIRQAVLALLQNTRLHGGPNVSIRLEAEDTHFTINVADDGPGLTPGAKSQAFERFFRGSNASQSYEEGTGLGLPVVKSIALAHGGSVTMFDRDGGGLIVSLRLPIKVPETIPT